GPPTAQPLCRPSRPTGSSSPPSTRPSSSARPARGRCTTPRQPASWPTPSARRSLPSLYRVACSGDDDHPRGTAHLATLRQLSAATPEEALSASLASFPSWLLRIECARCGKVRMLSEAHATDGQRHMRLRALLARGRHEGCGGQAATAALLTGT